jgi:hypothetical protein
MRGDLQNLLILRISEFLQLICEISIPPKKVNSSKLLAEHSSCFRHRDSRLLCVNEVEDDSGLFDACPHSQDRASIMETGRLLRPVAYVSQRARRHMRVSAPTPIPDIRLAAPDCRNRGGTAGAVQAACTSRYMPDRQAGGPL